MHEQYTVRNYFTTLGMQETIVIWKLKKKVRKKLTDQTSNKSR